MLLRTGQTIGPLLMGAVAVALSVGGAYYAIALLPLIMLLFALFTIKG
jgi:hypothetical protein